MASEATRKPAWIRVARTEGGAFGRVRRALRAHGLGTVCEEARCPNRGACWGAGTATFLLMGRQCTRRCPFCSVRPGRASPPPEIDEPERVARAAVELGLRHVVLTSVTRDDLEDGGARHIAATIAAVRAACPGVRVEALVPDLGRAEVERVLEAGPDVFAHNLEVVRELTPRVRDPRCSYDRSLEVLASARELGRSTKTKSSLLLGLGETDAEVERTLSDLRGVGVEMLCIGQYLQPTSRHLPVVRYVRPERFSELEALGLSLGFEAVASGPLVRTSYLAAELLAGLEQGQRPPAEGP